MATLRNPLNSLRLAPLLSRVDTRRIRLRQLLAPLAGAAAKLAACTLVLALQLIPQAAGTRASLDVPLYWHRLLLEQRAPALLQLELPAGEWQVTPESLGYFIEPDAGGSLRFVYAGEVPRGLIYGAYREGVAVLELSAPNDSEAFIDNHLAAIRDQVAELNARQNLLRLERRAHAARQSVPEQLADELWAEPHGGPGRPAASLSYQLRGQGETILAALAEEATVRARLKELYYSIQVARVDVWLAQFELQLALAGIPEPQFSELLSLGDSSMVRQDLLAEMQRLEAAWQQRQQELLQTAAAERQWLETHPSQAPPAYPAAPLPAASADGQLLRSFSFGNFSSTVLPEEVELAAAQARLNVAEAELAQLGAALQILSDAEQRVLAGRQPRPEELPLVSLSARRLREPLLERLPHFAESTDAARLAQNTLALCLQLTREFSDASQPVISRHSATARARRLIYTPDEVSYGLLTVDRCLASPRVANAAELRQLLSGVLADPPAHEMAAYDLGLLKLLSWYAQLPRDGAAARLFEGVAATADPQALGAQSQ